MVAKRKPTKAKLLHPVPGTIVSMDLYEVRGHLDTNEGRGGTYCVGWFVSYELAVKASQDKGVMGNLGEITPHTRNVVTFKDGGKVAGAFLLGQEINLYVEDQKEVRKRALSKLTSSERKALGLEDN